MVEPEIERIKHMAVVLEPYGFVQGKHGHDRVRPKVSFYAEAYVYERGEYLKMLVRLRDLRGKVFPFKHGIQCRMAVSSGDYDICLVHLSPIATNAGGFDQLGFGTLTYTLDSSIAELSPDREATWLKRTAIRLAVTGKKIRYSLTRDAVVTMKIYDGRGTLRIKTEKRRQAAGPHLLRICPTLVVPGNYCVELTADGQVMRKSFAVIR